jgi:hypothetical protein
MTKRAILAALAAAALPCLTSICLAQVKIDSTPDKIGVSIDGKPFTDFYIGKAVNKPFLHPLRAASGTIITRVWPMQEKEGEAKDHIHHQGLWFTHGDVNGIDFWANDPSQKSAKKGTVVLTKVNKVKSGKASGIVDASFTWNGPDGKPLLREDRIMTFYSNEKLRIIDFDIKLTGIESSRFGDTKEGTFAMRLTAPLDGKHSGKMVNAAGKVGEKQVWGKQSPWVDYSGKVNGEDLGVAIFDHPGNPKHPTYWHSRDYGLFAANIFGEHDFFNDKSRNGGLTLEPGKVWRFRYRVVIHPGDTQSANIASLYQEWTTKAGKGGSSN